MVCEPNARMCVRNCEPAPRYPQMIRIPFATNQNLSIFCANTKKTGCTRCPFHAPGFRCSPQVHGKLIDCVPNTHRMRTVQRVSCALIARLRFMEKINRVPNTHRMRTAQCVNGALLYTWFYTLAGQISQLFNFFLCIFQKNTYFSKKKM